jgi:hypothetical protein
MLVSEFVNGYKNLNKEDLQKDWCKKHLTKTYASIVAKNALLRTFIDASVKKNDKGIYFIDMVANKINFTYAVICLYTDLELDIVKDPVKDDNGETVKDDNGNVVTQDRHDIITTYDLFQEYRIIDVFCELIGDREINELLMVNEKLLDTWHEEHSTTRAYVSDMIEKAVRTFTETGALLKELNLNDINMDKILQLTGVTEE